MPAGAIDTDMLITKPSPVGLDIPIQRLQKYLHDELLPIWGLDPTDANSSKLYECYCRCHRNKTTSGYIAEWFTGADKNNYKEVYWNDELAAISFFGTASIETYQIDNKINVHLVFFVDLQKVKPGINHRADEEARNDVKKILSAGMFGFRYLSTETWLENVLREYPHSYRSDRLAKVDIHPVHAFRLNFELHYTDTISNSIC